MSRLKYLHHRFSRAKQKECRYQSNDERNGRGRLVSADEVLMGRKNSLSHKHRGGGKLLEGGKGDGQRSFVSTEGEECLEIPGSEPSGVGKKKS